SRRCPVLESVTVPVRLGGQIFEFRLYTRPLPLGPDVTVQYYWLDSRPFRHLNSAAAANFRNCVGHWAAAMRTMELGDDLEQQLHYITAVCYALVSGCKSLQHAFKDAYLAPHAAASAAPLSAAVHRRIQDTVSSQDRFQVQQELDQVLGR